MITTRNVITDYTCRKRKLATQKKIYDTIARKVFVGLCGPNIEEYLEKINYKRFKRIILYEIDPKLCKSLQEKLGSKYPTVTLICDNINYHLGKIKAFYDLDYCKGIGHVRQFLDKICRIEEFSITFAMRPKTLENTFSIFESHLGHGCYRHYSYRDGCTMVTLSVSKRLWGMQHNFNNNETAIAL